MTPVGVSVLRPELLWLLLLIPGFVAAWRLWPPPLQLRRSRFSLLLRCCLVALLVFSLAGARLTSQPQKRALVAVVDLSASMRSELDAEAATVRSLAAAKGPDDLFGVVTFGHDASVELPLAKDPAFDIFQTQPDPNYTDLAGALRLAAGLIPNGYARQLVLVSDGRQNLGDAAAAVQALRAEGVRVDTLPAGTAPSQEAAVLAVDTPAELREGQRLNLDVRLRSTGPAAGKLVLLVDGQEATVRDVSLPAGNSNQSFELDPLGVGLHRVRAELSVSPDTYTQNNVGEQGVRVLGRPFVLVLEGREGEGANLQAALEAAGMKVDRRLAAQAPTDTTTIGRYDSTVVVDAPADGLPRDAMAAMAAATRNLGKGLVTIGGPTSYGPGGWQGTPLEDAMPVNVQLPNRKEKPKVAVVLVMETMEDQRADQVALGAAEAVIDQLGPDDQVAVTDGQRGFLLPMTQVKDKKAIDAKLETGNLGDPVSYYPFLDQAGKALLATDAPLKHIVVLGDGDAADSVRQSGGDVQGLISGLLAQNVTTSTVGVDVHSQQAYMAYMADLARWGGGRFYQSNNPSQVPALFLKESLVSLRPWFEQENFFPKVTANGDLLNGVPLSAFPQLGGYVVTTPKPAAEVYFTTPKQDPLLAAWSYGLGRSVAWTSDSNGQWTAGLLSSPVSQRLFSKMVAWTLPGSSPEALQVDAAPAGDGIALTVSGPQTSGATLLVGVLDPDLNTSSQTLVGSGPGRWQGEVKGAVVGTYLIHAVLQSGTGIVAAADRVVSVPYPPEYLELGRDDGLLRLLAKEGSGLVLAGRGVGAWKEPPLPVPVSTDVFWILLAALAVLWPLDVAIRRLTLSPRQALELLGALARWRRPESVEVAAPAELVRLRSRLAGYRAAQTPAPLAPPARDTSEIPVASPQPEAQRAAAEEEALSARLLEARRRRRGQGD